MRTYIVTKVQTWEFEVEDFKDAEEEAHAVMAADPPDTEFIDYERVSSGQATR